MRVIVARIGWYVWTLLTDGWNLTTYPLGLGNWQRRTELLDYCTTVVDQALIEKRSTLEGQAGHAQDPASRRKIKGAMFEDEVKVLFNVINAISTMDIYNFIISEIKCETS